MKNINTIMQEAGIELTDEQRAAIAKEVAANYKTVADYDKQAGKYQTLESQYNEVKASLDKFDGVDVADLQKQIADAKQAAADAEARAKAQLEQRDYADAVSAAVSGLKFSSAAAQKQFTADVIAQNLPLKDGKLLGWADYVAAYKAQDAGAIVDAEAEANRATFTQPMGQAPNAKDPRTLEMERKLAAVMGIKDESAQGGKS